MITRLLLLLSLASAYVIRIETKNFQMMIQETLDKEIADSLPYGCSCTTPPNEKIANIIDRCCRVHRCCHRALISGHCYHDSSRYSYSYSNGIITCTHKQYMPGCAAETCECDRETVMCLRREEITEENAKYIKDESCDSMYLTCNETKSHANLMLLVKKKKGKKKNPK
ncbi:basic phospholipase A2 homolog APC-K49-like [Anomaloglossus baeobatrachus]|uniref:basic phospholipase A2 homolog APC-K49-like n=1 Tax=Anomaloglossus baeobatrachus TaxID=238106 RepID=UPI003F501942